MGAIANIARQRPDYMRRVVQTFEALQGKIVLGMIGSCSVGFCFLSLSLAFKLIYHRH